MAQLGLSRQTGLDITLKGVLTLVGSAIAGAEEVRAEFFALRLWGCSSQPCDNRQSYGQMSVTVGLSRSERSRNNLGRISNSSGKILYGREKWIGFDYMGHHSRECNRAGRSTFPPSRARADRDFTGSDSLGPKESDFKRFNFHPASGRV
jgi:hypothetical protein